MTQYWIVKDRASDYSVRKGLNGIVVTSFTTRQAAQRYIDRQYSV